MTAHRYKCTFSKHERTIGNRHKSENKNKMAGLLDSRNHPYAQLLKQTLGPRTPTPPQPDENKVDNAGSMEYRFEEVRLQSYTNWPCRYVQPADLAAAGFYYTGQIDKVRCFECRTEICRWEENDDPIIEHQRWGGRCRFIRKLPCGNVPIGADPNSIPPKSRDVCGYNLDYRMDAEVDTRASSSTDESSLTKRPYFGDYATYKARLQTFADWPTSMAQTKEQLADAGFFYTGTGDQTTCYHCGGGLKNWEPQDDPWVQHAKWFSTCFYVKLVKGQDFINNVSGKHQSPLSHEEIMKMKLPNCIKKVESPVSEKSEPTEESSSRTTTTENITCNIKSPALKPRTSAEVEAETKQSTSPTKSDSSKAEDSQQSEKKSIDDARVCKICYNEELGFVFMPCGHIVACVKCAPSMTTCAVCRKEVKSRVRAFFS
ncbi:baculoviral IAP repeat-containing protein 2-like isoform X2 [Phymastichus coffea]|uniref:baculoviral IAP repeat-containing protein 2-like isoform X2 n=1 Tax=Phymastichus coffea TaxID=108790 RepID=UPI00273C1C26|nr:baculoviral IAP repeat-containing protein 2-like isoform X2 [Phymastichus coffea]